ncbi:peptide synthetase [Streptomyces alboflavus]|uniref:Peptide synthetase n=1 Tax=Streptomyces alboflavus TaxID=67267 RepID=A0A1Z1WSS7_9ACTN|nr:peptide synthetase [Streptomyces alboflavus]
MSYAQQRMWFLEEFAPAAPSTSPPWRCACTDTSTSAPLARPCAPWWKRHESLRTTFDAVDGHGVQVVHPPGAVALPLEDLTGCPGGSAPPVWRTCWRPSGPARSTCGAARCCAPASCGSRTTSTS